MTRKISRIAAAVVLLVIGTGIVHIIQPSRSIALGAVVESMHSMPWVHIRVVTRTADKTEQQQTWQCFSPKISIRIDSQGTIVYKNYNEKTRYIYAPRKNTITISPTTCRFNIKGPRSPAEELKQMIAQFQAEAGKVSRKKSTLNGTAVEIVSLNNKYQKISLVLDAKRKIPLKMDTIGHAPQANEEFYVSAVFDYPAQGPEDIYSLNVPRDAKVIDNRPGDQVKQLLDQLRKRFEAGFEDHIAVVLASWLDDSNQPEPKEIVILRQKGNLKRMDRCHAFDFAGTKKDIPTLYPLIKDLWPNLTIADVLALQDDKYAEIQHIFDGRKTTIRTNFTGKATVNTVETDTFATGTVESLSSLTWGQHPDSLITSGPHTQIRLEILPDDPNRPNLTGLRITTIPQNTTGIPPGITFRRRICICRFDPAKNYMLVEKKTFRKADEGTSTFITRTTEAAQTQSGSWYPRRIRTESSYPDYKGTIHHNTEEKLILVDTSPKFKAGIFDGNSLK